MPLVRDHAPRRRGVRDPAERIVGLVDCDLAPLRVQVAHQFTRHVDEPHAALVVGLVEDVVLDPNVVRPVFRYFVTRHHFRLLRIGHIEDLDVPRRGPRVTTPSGFGIVGLSMIRPVPLPGEAATIHDLVADKQVELSS